MARKRILVSAPAQGFGTNLYRSTAPFSELRRRHDLDIVTAHGVEWDHAAYFDYAFFNWPNSPSCVDAVSKLTYMGVPSWVDFDDDPWNLQDDNPQKANYAPGGPVMLSIESCARESQIITVSTEHLKNVFLERFPGKKVEVLPNAYFDSMWPMSKAPRKKAILWRGALGHNRDLESVFPTIVEIQQKHRDWPWIFVGDADKSITDLLEKDQTIIIPHQHPNAYIRTLIDLATPIMVVPLLDHVFNLSKSNCSWLEATCAGTAVLAPGFLPEFVRPGITNYSDPQDFKEKLLWMMQNWETLPDLVEKSRWEVGKNYLLSNVNKKRELILGLK